MSFTREQIALIGVRLQVMWFNLTESLFVVYHFYSNLSFFKSDCLLLFFYLFKNPFRVSQYFLASKEEKEIYTYGETPLSVIEEVAKRTKINPKDCVFELGSGRGRVCFWLEAFLHCRVIGVDNVPQFIQIAEKVRSKRHLDRISFLQ